MIKISSRNINGSNSKRDFEKTINELNKQNQELEDKNFELKDILTQHKSEIQKSSEIIKDYKNILSDSNSCLKSMITTYFIFIDFYKQLQTVSLSNAWTSEYCQTSAELEQILAKDGDRITTIDFEFDKIQSQIDKNNEILQLKDDTKLQSFVQQFAVNNKDALQVYNEEYDLSKELGFESQRNSNANQYRTSSQCSISHQDLKLIKENEWLQKQLKELKNTIKKAKDNRNTMYFRNDRKMIELKKVYNEKEKLSEKCRTLESQYHNLKMLHFDKSEELREDKLKFDKLHKEFESLKASYVTDKQRAVQKAEKPLKAKTVSLEYDLRICKDKLKMSK